MLHLRLVWLPLDRSSCMLAWEQPLLSRCEYGAHVISRSLGWQCLRVSCVHALGPVGHWDAGHVQTGQCDWAPLFVLVFVTLPRLLPQKEVGTVQMAFVSLPRFQDCAGPCFSDSLYCDFFTVVSKKRTHFRT